MGEFNAWNEVSHKLSKVSEYGHFQIIIPSVKINGTKEFAIHNDTKIKILLVQSSGEKNYRLLTHVERATKADKEALTQLGQSYEGRIWKEQTKEKNDHHGGEKGKIGRIIPSWTAEKDMEEEKRKNGDRNTSIGREVVRAVEDINAEMQERVGTEADMERQGAPSREIINENERRE